MWACYWYYTDHTRMYVHAERVVSYMHRFAYWPTVFRFTCMHTYTYYIYISIQEYIEHICIYTCRERERETMERDREGDGERERGARERVTSHEYCSMSCDLQDTQFDQTWPSSWVYRRMLRAAWPTPTTAGGVSAPGRTFEIVRLLPGYS